MAAYSFDMDIFSFSLKICLLNLIISATKPEHGHKIIWIYLYQWKFCFDVSLLHVNSRFFSLHPECLTVQENYNYTMSPRWITSVK